ncbi:MAG: aldehyde dehydrogenase family protein [Cytophagaceae bacterium]|nr:aldehyde dehydrogenase family protein [Cytophagaceae bacterium]MDW8456015.1 aldehyde dehydrogenase family protein [Cytophagaceae bacterium]
MNIINPATEEIIATLEPDNKASALHKYELLKKSFHSWRQTKLTERIDIMKNYASILEKNIEACACILTTEVGKPLQQSRNEIKGAIQRILWLCDNAPAVYRQEWMRQDASFKEYIDYEPLGTICNISAWNYPYLVGINVYVPALLAGNTVAYKPSEYALLSGLQMQKLLYSAGLPENVFQVIVGDKHIGEELLNLNFDGYFFTGSYSTGKYIYEKVAYKMVPCQLELGGKDPLYVADDVSDITSVARSAADGAFYNNGQSCCSVERIYVHENIYEPFLHEFIQEVASYKIGLPTEQGVYIGPLTRRAQIPFLEEQIQDALNKGAKIMLGGKRIDRKGYYFEPTVLVEVNHEMRIMREESFGPVIGIMKVKDDEHAIELMNDTEYGLTGSVYSANIERAQHIFSKLNTGTVYWNCCDRVSPALPWSGRKHSGIGSTLSFAGLRAFVQPKAFHLKPA